MIRKLKVKDQTVSFIELRDLCSDFHFDIRYARADNFVKQKVYPSAHAFLLQPVADDLIKVHEALKNSGYGLLIYDGYRPWAVTKLFWDASNEHDRQFLANPEKGSVHNRACAVDLSLYDLSTGLAVQMPSDFDEMNEKAAVAYEGGEEGPRRARDLLRATLEAHHFTGIANEWWHYNHSSLLDWPIMNFSFEEIMRVPCE